MATKIYTISEIQKLLLPIFLEYDIKRAVLFGSYGKSLATVNSDIDLMVDSGLRGLKFVSFSEKVRQVLNKEVDIFDITHIDPQSKIDYEIKNTGVLLYEK